MKEKHNDAVDGMKENFTEYFEKQKGHMCVRFQG